MYSPFRLWWNKRRDRHLNLAGRVIHELNKHKSGVLPYGAVSDIARRVGTTPGYVSRLAKRHGFTSAGKAA